MGLDRVIASGTCGESVSYAVTENADGLSVLVYGKGEMKDYESAEASPFMPLREKITELTVENGVSSIGDNAFNSCIALKKLRLPPSVRYVGWASFSGCSALEEVSFCEGLRVIGPKAFENCSALKSLRLPSSLKAIDFKAFRKSGAESGLKVVYRGSEKQWKKCVRLATSSQGVKCIEEAEFSFAGESSTFRRMLSRLASVIEKGGDGRMYVVSPDLTVPDCQKKSGDCSMIIFPDGQTMLIDAAVPESGEHVINLLKALRMKKLDYFVVSHPHGDHIGGAMGALKQIEKKGGSVGTFLYSGFAAQKPGMVKILNYLEENGTKMLCSVREGDVFDIGGVHIELFNPDDRVLEEAGGSDGEVNSTSLAMKFTFKDSTYLTSGDLYAARERTVAARFGERLQADVAKSNHHGVFTSNTEEWYAAVRPKYLVSHEDGAHCTRVDERLCRLGIKNYKVSECGLVIVRLDGTKQYRITTEY